MATLEREDQPLRTTAIDRCKAFVTERTFDIDEENDFKDLEYIVINEKLTLPE